mgnify:CR=1 FL=1
MKLNFNLKQNAQTKVSIGTKGDTYRLESIGDGNLLMDSHNSAYSY